jgi:hypothetical protein
LDATNAWQRVLDTWLAGVQFTPLTAGSSASRAHNDNYQWEPNGLFHLGIMPHLFLLKLITIEQFSIGRLTYYPAREKPMPDPASKKEIAAEITLLSRQQSDAQDKRIFVRLSTTELAAYEGRVERIAFLRNQLLEFSHG